MPANRDLFAEWKIIVLVAEQKPNMLFHSAGSNPRKSSQKIITIDNIPKIILEWQIKWIKSN